MAGALLVGLLGANVLRGIAENPALPVEVQSQGNLDGISFVSNDRLRSVMERTSATPQQVEEAVRVNTEARLRALRIGLPIMACVALPSILPASRLPASRLPAYRLGEIPGGAVPAPGPGAVAAAGRG